MEIGLFPLWTRFLVTFFVIYLIFFIASYKAIGPQNNSMKLTNRWDDSGFYDSNRSLPQVLNADLKPASNKLEFQKNDSLKKNPDSFIKEITPNKNQTEMDFLNKYEAPLQNSNDKSIKQTAPDKKQKQMGILNEYQAQLELKKDDTLETGSTHFKLQERHENTFKGLALKKYSFYQQHIQKIQKQNKETNLEAISQAQQFHKQNLQSRFDNKGQLVEWENTRHRLSLRLLNLFPLRDIKQTSPYWFHNYWELFMRSCCSFMVEDRYGWNYLQNMLDGKGFWISLGSRMTLGSRIDSGFDYRHSDFNLFVPSIIRFVFPSNISDETQIFIYGIRMRYDLYLKKETYIFKEKLGRFKIVKSDFEKKNKMAIRKDFYCESERCHQAFSLVKISSTHPLAICGITIQSVYAYDWNEEKM